VACLVPLHDPGPCRVRRPARRKKTGAASQWVPLHVPEVQRLMQALSEAEDRLHWSRFRRQHQGRAQRFHRLHRAQQAPGCSASPPTTVRVLGVPALTDAHREQIRLLPPQKRQTGQTASDPHLMVEGMLCVARTSSPWRELPECFGPGDPRQLVPLVGETGPVGSDRADRASCAHLLLLLVLILESGAVGIDPAEFPHPV